VAKKLVVFADGTGNAFTTQESNVWRLYQAVDQSQSDQIARYIKGVGTSGFRPFAILDTATGIGVPSNVRELYRFLCWNWESGDEIYLFGFSRGSFTIRTLIGLIDAEGLVPIAFDDDPVSHADMQRNAMAAWRSYRAKSAPWYKKWPTIWIARVIRDILLWLYHLPHRSYAKVRAETDRQKRLKIPIRFVGLFDTVEAYGVPVEELRSAINWAIWPISFHNYALCGEVEIARHALSLDDERTTFHALRFDMTNETTDRIKEVWFAGVHSDVGGGYPDDALAHVPLVWMSEEAEIAQTDKAGKKTVNGLRFHPGALDRFRAQASPFGPRHDSREGLAVMFRYDPRHIADDKASGGPPVIHHSVAEKMVFGSENYAPLTLPSTAKILMPDGSPYPIQGFQREAMAKALPAPTPAMNVALGAVAKLQKPDQNFVDLALDTIWWRRVAYFSLLASVLLIASLPIAAEAIDSKLRSATAAVANLLNVGAQWQQVLERLSGAQGGVGTNLRSISKTIGGFLPSYTSSWIEVLIAFPLVSIVVLLLVLWLYGRNGVLRDRIADRARRAWFHEMREANRRRSQGAHQHVARRGLIARHLRENLVARGLYRLVSAYVLPGLFLLAIFGLAATAVSRTTASYRAGAGKFCQAGATAKEKLAPAQEGIPLVRKGFRTDQLCWPTGVAVEKGRHYTLWIEMTEPFFDQTIMVDIAGFRDFSARHLISLPIRRWWAADWFQPIARIGVTGNVEWPLEAVDGAEAPAVGRDAAGNPIPARFHEAEEYRSRLAALNQDKSQANPRRLRRCEKIPETELPAAQAIYRARNLRTTYVSQFQAEATGELFLYLNDAIAAIPFGRTIECFYANNSGVATVTIERADVPKP
jgi:uncharacterized protein (DUF2235 family)